MSRTLLLLTRWIRDIRKVGYWYELQASIDGVEISVHGKARPQIRVMIFYKKRRFSPTLGIDSFDINERQGDEEMDPLATVGKAVDMAEKSIKQLEELTKNINRKKVGNLQTFYNLCN